MTLTDRTVSPSENDQTTGVDATVVAKPVRIPTLELAGMAALASVVAIHATELGGKVDEIAYIGAGYVALIAGCLIAMLMLAVGDRRGWTVAGSTAAATLGGYILTRTVGLPGSTGDIGNWLETLAVWAMVSEIVVIGLSVIGLTTPPQEG